MIDNPKIQKQIKPLQVSFSLPIKDPNMKEGEINAHFIKQ